MVVWALVVCMVVFGLMTLVVLDRVGFAVSGHSWLAWRRNRKTQAALATGLDQVTALFYATKHYELDQRKTEIMLRDDSDDGAPRAHGLDLRGERPTFVLDPRR